MLESIPWRLTIEKHPVTCPKKEYKIQSQHYLKFLKKILLFLLYFGDCGLDIHRYV